MAQTVSDIISRAAWEVNDESFEIIKKPEMVKALDRVYRQYCQETRILTNTIGFLGDGSNNEYDLYGYVTGTTTLFGDNFFKLYRVTYQGERAEERDFEYIHNTRQAGSENNIDGYTSPIHYAIKYLGKYQRMYFTFILPDDSEVVLWYYEYPRIGSIVNLTDTLGIDDKNTDDLVVGLKVWALNRQLMHYLRKGSSESLVKTVDEKYASHGLTIASVLKTQYQEAKNEWTDLLLKRRIEFSEYREEVTPTVSEIGTPFEGDSAFSWEEDNSGFDEL